MRSFSGPKAFALAGITFRMGDYWARAGVVSPSVMEANGSGTQRRYSALDVHLPGYRQADARSGLVARGGPVDGRAGPYRGDRCCTRESVVIVEGECFVVGDAVSALAVLEVGQVAHVLRPEPLRELASC